MNSQRMDAQTAWTPRQRRPCRLVYLYYHIDFFRKTTSQTSVIMELQSKPEICWSHRHQQWLTLERHLAPLRRKPFFHPCMVLVIFTRRQEVIRPRQAPNRPKRFTTVPAQAASYDKSRSVSPRPPPLQPESLGRYSRRALRQKPRCGGHSQKSWLLTFWQGFTSSPR